MKKLLLVFLLLTSLASAQDAEQKPWINKQTIAQLSIVGGAYAFDAYSTRSGKWNWKNGEMNPVLGSKPSTGKTAGYFAASFGATVATSYVLRRHNRVRWIATGVIAAGEVYLASRNIHYDHVANHSCLNNPLCSLR